jgi:O-antigen ligase
VSYAAIIVVFLPFVFFLRTAYERGTFKRFLLTWSIPIYLVGLYFSYTRACYLALFAMIGAYFILKWRLVKVVIPLAVLMVLGVIYYIAQENYYLKYAPTTSTVAHKEFGDLIDATLKAEDVSSMERVYRWIAAAHMIKDKPITGFGPNGFVPNYKNYTVFIFETWISENEEQSGVHNYFLMMAVEQGIPGLIIFLALIIAFFIFGEKTYHQAGDNKIWAMAALLSMIAILVNLLFSDMIEVDKTGSFFFINLALVVLVSRNFKGLMLK